MALGAHLPRTGAGVLPLARADRHHARRGRLCTEISFYLFLPLYAALIVARRRSDRPQLRRELSGVAGLFVRARPGAAILVCCTCTPPSPTSLLEWLPSCLDLFALGMLPGGVEQLAGAPPGASRAGCGARSCPGVSWAAGAGACCGRWRTSACPPSPLQHNTAGRGVAQEFLYGLVRLLPVAAGGLRAQRSAGSSAAACNASPWWRLGVVSYGVYLWHQAWGQNSCVGRTHLFRVAVPRDVRRRPGPVGGHRPRPATSSWSGPSCGSRTAWGGGAGRAAHGRQCPRWGSAPRRADPVPSEASSSSVRKMASSSARVRVLSSSRPTSQLEIDAHHEEEQRRQHGQQGRWADDPDGMGQPVEETGRRPRTQPARRPPTTTGRRTWGAGADGATAPRSRRG